MTDRMPIRDYAICVIVTIPGEPIAQGRGRAVRVGPGVRIVDPKRSRAWKAVAHAHMQEAMGDRPIPDGPLAVTIRAVWPPSGPPRKREPRPECWRPKSPDADNVAKAVLDAGNGVLWLDDRQVVELRVTKRHAAQGEGPRVEVAVESVDGPGQRKEAG